MAGGDPNAIRVHVAPDRATAELTIPPNVDRSMLSVPICEQIIRDAGVEVTAFTHQCIEDLLKQAADTEHPVRGLVAQSTPPVHGENGRVEWVESPAAPPADAAADPDAKQSYYDCSAFVIVKPGDVIGKIIRPTQGEDGRDVMGKSLVARAGQEQPLQLDETIMCDASGKLIAQVEGVLMRNGPSACIRAVLEVAEYVDFSTGNIDFRGDVYIRKGVRDLFVVHATGNIEVHGLIEAATMIAGQDLIARGGFAGRERGRAEVGRHFLGRYVDNVDIEVRGDLSIDREVINSQMIVHGSIHMPHGAIIGGHAVATGKVHIGTLGSGGAVATQIVLGSVPRLEPLLSRLHDFVDRLKTRRDEVAAQRDQLEVLVGKKRATSIDKERQTEMFFELCNLDSMLKRAEPTLQALTQRVNSLRTVDLVIERRAFPGVSIICGNQSYQLTTELRGPLRIVKDLNGALAYYHGDQRVGLLVEVSDLRAAA